MSDLLNNIITFTIFYFSCCFNIIQVIEYIFIVNISKWYVSGITSSGSDHKGPGRSVTRLSDVTNWRERMPIKIDPRSSETSGPWEKKYCSYIGMLAKTKVSIAIACWDDVAEVEKNLLWQDLVVCLLKPTIVFFMLLLT